MRVTHAGDMARSLGLTQAYTRSKSRLDILTREVSTGRKADVAASLRGDTRGLAGISNQLRRLEAFASNTTEAGLRLNASQEALGGISEVLKGRGTAYLNAPLGDPNLRSVLTGAESNLEAVLGLMNTQTAGQFIFSGERSNTAAVIGPTELIAQIEGRLAGATTADEIISAVNQYFDGSTGTGGYLDNAVSGSARPAGALPITSGEVIRDTLTAADPALRDVLKGLSLAVLAAKGLPGGELSQRMKLVEASGQVLTKAENGVTNLRANQGVLQERVERAQARNGSERSGLMIAQTGILEADPYESAAALTEAEVQLNKLYAITARLSRLSLADRL